MRVALRLNRSAVSTALTVRDEVLLQTLQLPIDIRGGWFCLLDIAQVRYDRNPYMLCF